MAKRTEEKWNALKPTYRRRLERNGITLQRYLSGQSLAKSRGHATTPERPSRATKRPERYPEYLAKRATLTPRQRASRMATMVRNALDTGQIEAFAESADNPEKAKDNINKIDASGHFIELMQEWQSLQDPNVRPPTREELEILNLFNYDYIGMAARAQSIAKHGGEQYTTIFFYHTG